MTRILLVVRSPGNVRVLRQALRERHYEAVSASDGDALHDALREPDRPHLALVDVGGFGEAVWPMCAALQEADVAFVVLSRARDLGVGQRTLAHGASGILQKPVVKESLLQLVDAMSQRVQGEGPTPT